MNPRSSSRTPSSTAPWIAFGAVALTLIVNTGLNAWQSHQDNAQRLLEHRREALFSALEVIDHVYANLSFDNKPPVNPHKWPIAQARAAMNGILVYCDDPGTTVASFERAIGLHNPEIEPTPVIRAGYIDEFRHEVARELALPVPSSGQSMRSWIATLPGGE
jgi:hypothetical protein